MKLRKCLAGMLAVCLSAGMVPGYSAEAAEDEPLRIYVSTDGSGTAEGTMDDPASLDHAMELAREASVSAKGDIEVLIEGGTYYLDETLEFTREDSGKDGHSIIWRAADSSDRPVFSGGKVLEHQWELYDAEKNIYKYEGADFTTRDLYVNGTRSILARSRNTVSGLEVSTSKAAWTEEGLKGEVADIVRGYGDISQLEAVRNVRWRHFEAPVEKVDEDTVYMNDVAWSNTNSTNRIHYDWNGASWKAYGGGVTYFQNAYALLDTPGEFYLDHTAHVLYYIPREGEDMQTAEVIAPVLDKIMVLEGRDKEQITEPQPRREKGGIVDEKIENITFDGIIFRHNSFLDGGDESGYIGTQGGHSLTGPEEEGPFSDPWGSYAAPPQGAVYVNSGNQITFQNCEFSKIGTTALMVTKGSRNCTIDHNTFSDLSGGAVYLGDAKHTSDTAPDPYKKGPSYSIDGVVEPAVVPLEERELSYNNTISYNYVSDTGKQYSDTCAIWCGYESNLKVVHNTVDHVPYTGINIGWGWRETGRVSRMADNYIAYNRVVDFMMKETDMHDGGGLYMINAMPGTIVEYNYFNRNGVDNAVYFDAGLDYAVLRNNVMTNIEYKWVSANVAAYHRGLVGYDNYIEKGYGTTNGRPDYTFDGEYSILGDNYIYTQVLPAEAEEIARNAGCDAPYGESSADDPFSGVEMLYYNAAEGKNASQSSLASAGNAVDGSMNNYSLTQKEENPWWQVDLGRSLALKSVDLYGTDKNPVSDFYVLVSEQDFGTRTLGELLGDPSVTSVHIPGSVGSPSTAVLPEGTQGRYVRVVLNGTGILGFAEVQVNLDMDSRYVPYLKDMSATMNLQKAKDVSYEIYHSGNPVSAVYMDGEKLPETAYRTEDTTLVRNEFLSEENIEAYLEKIGEDNPWYDQLSRHYRSIQDSPKSVEGCVLTLDSQFLEDNGTPGSHEIEIQFEKGMELEVSLELTSVVPETLAYYGFDEESDDETVKDQSDRENDLTIHQNPERTEGISGSALSIDKEKENWASGDVDLGELDKELLVDFYVKVLPRESGNAQLVNKRAMGKTTGFMVDLLKDNTLRFTVGAGGNVISTPTPVPENEWIHVTCTYQNLVMKLYINGELEAQKTLTSQPVMKNDLPLTLGKHADNTEKFTGYLDELLIQNAVEDTVSPVILGTEPENGAQDADLSGGITLELSENAVPTDREADIRVNGHSVEAAAEIKNNQMYLKVVKPEEGFVYDAEYQVTVPAGAVRDAEGNALKNAYTFTFHTKEGKGTPFTWEDSYSFYAATPRDLKIELALQGHKIDEISCGDAALPEDAYVIKDSTVTIRSEYLQTLAEGPAELKIGFDDSTEIALEILVLDEAEAMTVVSYDFSDAADHQIKDLSGNENHGYLEDESAVVNDSAEGCYLNMDGTEKTTIVTESSPSLEHFSDIYLEMKILVPQENAKTMTLISKKAMGGAGFGLELHPNGAVNFVMRKSSGGNASVKTGDGAVTYGSDAGWQTIRAVYDSETKTARIFVNHKLQAEQAVDGVTAESVNNPDADLAFGWAYNSGTDSSQKSSFYTGLMKDITIKNTAARTDVPEVVSILPENGAFGVSVNTSVQIEFNREIKISDAQDHQIQLRTTGEDTQAVPCAVSSEGNSITIDPEGKLEYGREYELLIPALAVSDLYENYNQGEVRSVFTTITGNAYIEAGSKEQEYDSQNPSEVCAELVLNGNTVTSVKNVNEELPADAYVIENGTLRFSQDYLSALENSVVITVEFSSGRSDTLTINVIQRRTAAEYILGVPGDTVKDLSGNGNDGNLNTKNTVIDDERMGKVLTMDGSMDSAIQISDSESLHNFKDLTVELWIRVPKKNTATQTLVSKKGMGAAGFGLELHADQSINFVIRGTSGNVTVKSSPALITVGENAQWHHVTAVYDSRAQEISIDIDGVKKSAQAAKVTSATLNNSAINLNLGHAVNGTTANTEKSSFFEGEAAYLALVNSAEDIKGARLLNSSVEDGAQDIADGTEIVMTFSETITVDQEKISLISNGETKEYDCHVSGNILTIVPAQLKKGQVYELSLAADSVKDSAGNAMADAESISFSTEKGADKQKLEDLYNQWKDETAPGYLKETWENFQKALAQAESVLQDDAAEQEDVDQSYEDLQAAAEGLRVSKTTLEYFLNQAKAHVENGDTEGLVESVKQMFDEAIAEGEALMAKENASKEEVKNAAMKLMLAIQALDMKAGDKTDLEMALELAGMIDLDQYVEAGQKEYLAAKEAAEDVLADKDAMQPEVDSAWQALTEAMTQLRLRADKAALAELLNSVAGLDLKQYTEESVQTFQAALASARAVLADISLTAEDQQTVDHAVMELTAAKDGLQLKEDLSGGEGENPDPGTGEEDGGSAGDDGTSGFGSGTSDDANEGTGAGTDIGTPDAEGGNGAANSSGGSDGSRKAAKTGDAASAAGPAAMMLAGALAAGAVTIRRRQRR